MENAEGTIYQQVTGKIAGFVSTLSPTPVQSTMVKFANYSPGATSNSLSILFSVPANPAIDSSSKVSVTLPSGFAVPTNP